MVRKLKFHEKKLLKKVDFLNWQTDHDHQAVRTMKKYMIQKREDYSKYNKLAREVREIARKIKELDPKDHFRTESSAQLLVKLYSMGVVTSKSDLSFCDVVTASSFCRRRLPVVMVRNKMAENLKSATSFIEQGHVRVGPELIKDPAFLVSRGLEDFVTWVDQSAIRKQVLKYNDEYDDFDFAG